MTISCSFCVAAADFESTAAALDAGWYTHTHFTGTVTIGCVETTPQSMGFVCPRCVGRMSEATMSIILEGDDQ